MATATFVEQVRGKPPAAVSVVLKQALGRPSVYFYGQLLHQAEVQALASQPVHCALLDVLQLFTYGTLADLHTLKPEARELVTPGMITKLKRLTLVSLAHQDRRLSYDKLFKTLDVADGRELEDLIIDAITEGLLAGRIDQQNRTLEVSFAASRDVKLADVAQLKSALASWSDRCAKAIHDLRRLAAESEQRAKFEAAITSKTVEDESKISDECKKELLEMDIKPEDAEWAPGVMPGRRVPRGSARF
jgi:COP9 signalosome complex subunit 7